MTPLEIIQLIRLALSAAASISIDVVRVKQMIEANGGDLSDEDVALLLVEAQDAIDNL